MPHNFENRELATEIGSYSRAELTGLSLTSLVVPEDSIAKATGKQFAGAALYSLFQSPLNGVTQIVDTTFGSDYLRSVQVVPAPQKAETWSLSWHAQEVGNAVGMALPFLLLHSGVRAVGKCAGMDVHQSGLPLTLRQFRNEAILAGTTGAAYGAFLTPSSPKESLLIGRSKNAVEQGLTFATLAAVAGGFKLAGQATENRIAGKLLKNEVLITAAAGIPAGSVSADIHSVLGGKGLASWKDRAASAYTFMFAGGVLGVANYGAEALGARRISTANERNADTTLSFDLGERGRLGAEEKPLSESPGSAADSQTVSRAPLEKPDPLTETRVQRKEREAREAREKVEQFLERPNPTSLAEVCRSIAKDLQRQIRETEQRGESDGEFYAKRIAQFDEAARKLEEMAAKTDADVTSNDLDRVMDQIRESSPDITRDLKELLEANSPAKLVIQEYGGYQYRIASNGTCLRTDGRSVFSDGRSERVVFVDHSTAVKIRELHEDGHLAGKSFPASAEFKEGSYPVQLGDGYNEGRPIATIEDGVLKFPDNDGWPGVVKVGASCRLLSDKPPGAVEVARIMAASLRKNSATSKSSEASNRSFREEDLKILRTVWQTVEQFPSRNADDSPMHIFDLAAEIRKATDRKDALTQDGYDFKIQPLIELIYDHAPTRLTFTTEKGSGYRLYADGSLGRLKYNGFTKDRCEHQYFADPADGQKLLDAANERTLGDFTIKAYLTPEVGRVPLSIHQAGRVIADMPAFVDGNLRWPSGRGVRFEGHVGHAITSIKELALPSAEVLAAGAK